MYRYLFLLLLLFSAGSSAQAPHDQPRISVETNAPKKGAAPAPRQAKSIAVNLKVGDGQEIVDLPAMPFTLECYDLITGKDVGRPTLLVDSGMKWAYLHIRQDTPRQLCVQIIKDNATLWRCVVMVGEPGPPPPLPAWQYAEQFAIAAAADQANVQHLLFLKDIFIEAAGRKFTSLSQCYSWLRLEYARLPNVTPATRNLLADILVVELGDGTKDDPAALERLPDLAREIAGGIQAHVEKGPKPPGPGPVPTPAAGLKVLLVRERQNAVTLKQEMALQSLDVARYLNEKCAKDERGRPAWRFWDPNQVLANQESAMMKALWAEVQTQVAAGKAFVVVKNDKMTAPAVLPLPDDEAALLAKLQEYGGK